MVNTSILQQILLALWRILAAPVMAGLAVVHGVVGHADDVLNH
jgi:hypothetical protein